jgi:iron complex outermembrane receptor protein
MYNDNASLPYKNPVSGVTLSFPVDQAVSINPFDVTNVFVNYTIKNASWLRGSKLGLAVTNLLDSHNIVGVAPAVAPTATTPYVYSPYDQINILPGRSIMATFIIGYAPKR